MAEVIKYAFIKSKPLYELLNSERITADSGKLEDVIAECVQIKADIVAGDEFDNGERQLLNFGHTIGHIIEKDSNYTLPHGFAVALGMDYVTARVNAPETYNKLHSMLVKYDLPCEPSITSDEIRTGVMNDKKKRGDYVTMVLVREIGEGELQKMNTDELMNFAENK